MNFKKISTAIFVSVVFAQAFSLGEAINTKRGERFPAVSADGKYLFFTRWFEIGNEDVMWVSANIIADIKKEVFNPTNKKK